MESDVPLGLVDVEGVMVGRILEMVEYVVRQGVGFVGCQKCVHRRVKSYCEGQASENGCGVCNGLINGDHQTFRVL